MKLVFIICWENWDASAGGICALHQLCHELNLLGEEAYILSKETHPSLNAPFLGNRKIDLNRVVAIYPEVKLGNQLQAKNVVRWILNTPGVMGGVSADGFYAFKMPTDLIFKYDNIFKLRDETENKGILVSTFSDKLGCFYNTNLKKQGSAFLIKKGGMTEKWHPDDAIDLGPMQSNIEQMARVLRTVERFYCYDNVCYWAYLATLCGCMAIVPKHPDIPTDKHPGIAYGLENIPFAVETLPLVRKQYLATKEYELNTVKNFIKICYQHFAA